MNQMQNQELSPDEWLSREDKIAYEDRLARLEWAARNMPPVDHLLFRGGLISKYLFEEARYCFVYGQFLATVILGMAFIEHTLAGLFYAAGRDDLERAGIWRLLKEALAYNLITQDEYDKVNQARKRRNPIAHFRRPGANDTVEYRSIIDEEFPYELLERDAYDVMNVVLHLLGVYSVGGDN